MPERAPRPCASPGCPELVPYGRCKGHQRKAAQAQRQRRDPSIYHTSRWLRERMAFLAEHPLCECEEARCGHKAEGRCWAPARAVDHVVPILDQVTGQPTGVDPWDQSNWRARCTRCHNRKTAVEGRLGKR